MGLFGFGKKEKDKMKDGLEKTRTGFWGNILNTLTGSKIDDDLYDELEEQLILADVGGDVAMKLVDALRDRVQEKGLKTGEQAADALRDIIADEMRPEAEMALDGHPAVILVIGVNGVGKTTSIAKLADYYTRQGKKVMLAAGDTFRAAASEQLEIWAGRAGVPIVKAGEGADPAAVVYDTISAAKARHADVDDTVTVRFRVGAVYKNCYIAVYLDDKQLQHRKRPVMAPGEMEQVVLQKKQLIETDNPCTITIKIEEA